MGPHALVAPEPPPLIVHDFIQVLDEFEPDDAVIGGASVGDEVLAVSSGLRVQRIDEVRVEDGIYAVVISILSRAAVS